MKKANIGYSIFFSILKGRRSVKDFLEFCHTRAGQGQTIALCFHNVPLEPNMSERLQLKKKDLKKLVQGLHPIADNIIFCNRINIRTGEQEPLGPSMKAAIKACLKTEIKEKKPMKRIIDEIIAENPKETDDGIVLKAVTDDYEVTVLDKSFNLVDMEKVKVILEEVES